jgi:hypothetical protein
MDPDVWGAICLVIDRSIQPPAYNIEILDLQKFGTLFSQELYVGCVYNCSETLFHSFEIDSGFVGFSFVDSAEAKDFSQKVLQAIPKHDPNVPTAPMQRNAFKSFVTKASMATGIKIPGVQQGLNIGNPTGFVHKQHIGYDPAKGFECSDIPESWKTVFRSAGIKKADLQSPEKASVIYDILQKELGENPLDRDPLALGGAPAPAVPGKAGKKAPPVPKRAEEPPADIPDCPAPPDAPGPPPALFAPPEGKAAGGGGVAPRGNLLADIQKGKNLKKVEEKDGLDAPARPASKSASTAPDSNLMGALQNAMKSRFTDVHGDKDEEDEPVDDWSD